MNETATIDTPKTTATEAPAAPVAEGTRTTKKIKKIKKSMLPRKIGYFILYVPDMNVAVDFYRGKLGLKLGYESAEWTEFKCGTKFALHLADTTGSCSSESSSCGSSGFKAQHTNISFTVKDAHKSYAAFQQLGIKTLGEPMQVCEDGGHCFAFEDPFGNTLSIYGK